MLRHDTAQRIQTAGEGHIVRQLEMDAETGRLDRLGVVHHEFFFEVPGADQASIHVHVERRGGNRF